MGRAENAEKQGVNREAGGSANLAQTLQELLTFGECVM